jgi:hypothetical protein
MEFFTLINEYSIYIMLGMAAFIILLFILYIVNIVQSKKLKKRYEKFMQGKDSASLEDNLIRRVSEIENLIACNKENTQKIDQITQNLNLTFQKVGMVKYDAFHEMGGKLSFSLALLNQTNDGFIINAMHSREGCYTYIKEIIKGNSIIVLSEEEKEALDIATGIKKEIPEE